MYQEYVVKIKDRELNIFFIGENNVIYKKIIKEDTGEVVTPIIENMSKIFSVNVIKNNQIFIFCRKITGEIIIAIENNEKWEYKHILKQYNGAEIRAFICDNLNEIRLIYSIKAENKGILISQLLSADGKWGMGERIDSIVAGGIFDVRCEERNIIIFYEQNENAFGYRIIKENYIGSFILLNKLSNFITDTSFLWDKGEIHTLYSVKSMLTGHLYYKHKYADNTENMTMLYEGAVSRCCIYKIKDILYFIWSVGENVFCRESLDNGNSFSKTSKINAKCGEKCGVISDDKNMKVYEAFMNNGKLSHLPCVYPDLYKYSQKNTVEKVSKDSTKDELQILKIKNRINMLAKSNNEKDRQIEELTKRVYSKNRESIESEVKLIKEIRKLKEENEKLRSIIEDKNESPH